MSSDAGQYLFIEKFFSIVLIIVAFFIIIVTFFVIIVKDFLEKYKKIVNIIMFLIILGSIIMGMIIYIGR